MQQAAISITMSIFKTEEELNWISAILRLQLAEPYSIYTYNYFLTNWPQLTVMAYCKEKTPDPIGCIIGSFDTVNPRKAYIAMLVVVKEFRRHQVGKKLFEQFYRRVEGKVNKIVLETECINKAALNFYLKLGFFKTRKMSNYYLSGNDAYRLKLYLPEGKQENDNKFEKKQIKNQQSKDQVQKQGFKQETIGEESQIPNKELNINEATQGK